MGTCAYWGNKEEVEKLKITYLGTGAAEGIPAVFCHCNICKYARTYKGKNIKTRSQSLIDDNLLIDFGPDTYMHSLRYEIELANIGHCLITHTHDDHLYVNDLKARRRSRANLTPGTPPLHVYGSRGIEEELSPDENGFITKDKSVQFHKLTAENTYCILDYEVTPLHATHGSNEPFIYAIRKEGKTILYGHDTDCFAEDTWVFLKNNKMYFDLVSLDCTEGKKHIDYPGHMNFERMVILCNRMHDERIIDDKTIIVANHISHNGLVSHDEAESIGESLGFIVAFDGLEIEI